MPQAENRAFLSQQKRMIAKVADSRPLLLVELAKDQPVAVLAATAIWSRDQNANVRRAASEGLRGLVQRQPSDVRMVLEQLRADPDPYVKKSVANVLRNATRTQPDFVLELCAAWARESSPHTRWIVRDGLRKMTVLRPAEAARVLAQVAPSA
ncbi:MAG: DNA alkylation repair protein [Gemmatimonadaceae bacterium]